MDIKQLQYFVTSVNTGSLHAAAEALITSQPNVSKVIKALEQDLEMTLLERDRSGVRVTADGEIIYRYAMNVLQNYKMIHEIKRSKKRQKLLICGTPGNEMAVFVAEFYRTQADPNLQVECQEDRVEKIIIQIHRRVFDLGFVYIPQKNLTVFQSQIKNKGLEFCEMCQTPLYLFVGKDSPYFQQKKVTEEEVRRLKLVQYAEEMYSLYNQLVHLKGSSVYGENKPAITYTNSDHFLVQLLKSADYASIGSSFVENKYEEYGVQAVAITGHATSVSFGYLRRSKDMLSTTAQDFLAYLKKQIKSK